MCINLNNVVLIINSICEVLIYLSIYLSYVFFKIFFFRDSIPGPLTDVLDGSENKNTRTVTRHESIGGQDPGVVGPIVWDLHCKQMKIKSSEFR